MHSIDLMPLVYFMRNEIGVGASNWSLTIYKYRRKHHAHRTTCSAHNSALVYRCRVVVVVVAMPRSPSLDASPSAFFCSSYHSYFLHLFRIVRCARLACAGLLFPFQTVLFAFHASPSISVHFFTLLFTSTLCGKNRFSLPTPRMLMHGHTRAIRCVAKPSHPYQWVAVVSRLLPHKCCAAATPSLPNVSNHTFAYFVCVLNTWQWY